MSRYDFGGEKKKNNKSIFMYCEIIVKSETKHMRFTNKGKKYHFFLDNNNSCLNGF